MNIVTEKFGNMGEKWGSMDEPNKFPKSKITMFIGLISFALLAIMPFVGPMIYNKVPGFMVSLVGAPRIVFNNCKVFYIMVTLLLGICGGIQWV